MREWERKRKESRMQNKQVSKQGRANPIKKIFICLINWGQSIFRPKICGILFYFIFISLLFFQFYFCCLPCNTHASKQSKSNEFISHSTFFLLVPLLICMEICKRRRRRRKKETTFLNWLYWYNNLFIQGWFRSTFVPIYSHSIYINTDIGVFFGIQFFSNCLHVHEKVYYIESWMKLNEWMEHNQNP